MDIQLISVLALVGSLLGNAIPEDADLGYGGGANHEASNHEVALEAGEDVNGGKVDDGGTWDGEVDDLGRHLDTQIYLD